MTYALRFDLASPSDQILLPTDLLHKQNGQQGRAIYDGLCSGADGSDSSYDRRVSAVVCHAGQSMDAALAENWVSRLGQPDTPRPAAEFLTSL